MTSEPDELYATFEGLFAAQRRLRSRDARIVDGTSLAQFRMLRVLAGAEAGMPIGKLAERLGVTAAAVTQMLDGLEARGLVERQRRSDDRRVITIELTAAGRRRAEESREHHLRLFREAFAGLSDAELRAAGDALRRCAAYLDAL